MFQLHLVRYERWRKENPLHRSTHNKIITVTIRLSQSFTNLNTEFNTGSRPNSCFPLCYSPMIKLVIVHTAAMFIKHYGSSLLLCSYFLECGWCPVDFLEEGQLLGLSFLEESVVPGFLGPGVPGFFLSCSDLRKKKRSFTTVSCWNMSLDVAPNKYWKEQNIRYRALKKLLCSLSGR